MDLGFVYFVFAPSVVTTLFAGRAVARFGTRPAIWGALAVAALGLPLMLSSHLPEVLTGMVLVGVGTFFAQACATGFVGQAASDNRGVASGTYLACYFLGGLVGSAVLGQLFDRFGWTACVAGVGASLAIAALLDRAPHAHSIRRVSGMNSQITVRPRAAIPASPMKAMLLPKVSLI